MGEGERKEIEDDDTFFPQKLLSITTTWAKKKQPFKEDGGEAITNVVQSNPSPVEIGLSKNPPT